MTGSLAWVERKPLLAYIRQPFSDDVSRLNAEAAGTEARMPLMIWKRSLLPLCAQPGGHELLMCFSLSPASSSALLAMPPTDAPPEWVDQRPQARAVLVWAHTCLISYFSL